MIQPPSSDLSTQEYSRSAALAVLGFMVLMTLCLELARLPLVILVDPVRGSFGISDVQVSLLLGLFSSAPFLLMSLVGGWLSDHVSRRLLLAIAVSTWSVGALLCATAPQFEFLVFGRILIGAGAGMKLPIAMTWINDAFPAGQRGRAIGSFFVVLGSGPSLAVMLAGAVQTRAQAGGLGALSAATGLQEPWRVTLVLLAAPGLILLPAVLALRDRRSPAEIIAKGNESRSSEFSVPLLAVALIVAAAALIAFVDASNLSWLPTIFTRDYHFDAQSAGLAFGVTTLIAGTAGPLAGGWLGDFLYRRGGLPSRVRLAASAAFFCAPMLCAYLVGNSAVLIVALTLAGICTVTALSLSYVTVQAILSSSQRGFGTGVMSACTTLLGSAGPTAVALASRQMGGASTLSAPVVVVAGTAALCASLMLACCGRVLRRAQTSNESSAAAAQTVAAI